MRPLRDSSALEMKLGLEMGLFTREDVGRWVDCEVARLAVLPDPLLELTTLGGKHDVDIANLLAALGPQPRRDLCARIELSILRELVSSGRIPIERAVVWASRIAEDVSWEVYVRFLGLEDEYQLAEEGRHGSVADVERRFREELDTFGSVED